MNSPSRSLTLLVHSCISFYFLCNEYKTNGIYTINTILLFTYVFFSFFFYFKNYFRRDRLSGTQKS